MRTESQMLDALADFYTHGLPVELTLTPIEAFATLANLQLALRHPQNQGPAAETCARLCDRLIAAIAPDPVSDLHALCLAGFYGTFDTVKRN